MFSSVHNHVAPRVAPFKLPFELTENSLCLSQMGLSSGFALNGKR